MADFDQAQSPRLGQPTPVEATSVRMFSGTDIPEAAWPGQIIYRTDTQGLQVYTNAGAWADVVGGAAGLLTYVGPDAPGGDLSIGDLWFDSDDGHKLYRWNGSSWVSVQDAAIAAAQAQADTALAQGVSAEVLAEQKSKTFIQTSPPTSVSIGDLWFDSDDGYKQYRAAVAGATTIASGQWESVRDADIVIGTGKNKVFYTTSAPTADNTGDLWFDTDDGYHPYVWNGSSWADARDATIAAAQVDATTALTAANGKNKVFYSTSAPTATATNDLWFDTDDGYKPYIWDGAAWVTVRDATIAAAQGDATSALSVANGKNKIFWAASAPTASATSDIWYDTSDGNKIYQWSGSAWVAAQLGTNAIANLAINSAQIAANAITTAKVATDAITSAQIAADAVTSSEIAAAAVGTSEIATGAVDSAQIAANAITTAKIAANAVDTAQINANAITSGLIAANAVTSTQIATDAVTSPKILAGAVIAGKIATDAVTANEIAAGSVTASELAAGSVIAGKIAADAVTATEIAAGAVSTSELAANAVTAGKIAAGSVTTEKLTVGSLGASLFRNGSFEEVSSADPTLPASWQINVLWGGSTPALTTSSPITGAQSMNLPCTPTTASHVLSEAFPVIPGQVIAVRFKVKSTSGSLAGLYARLIGGASPTDYSVMGLGTIENLVAPATVTDFSDTITVPAGMTWARYTVLNYGPAASGTSTLTVDDVSAQQVIISAQIADGAITTPKIVAGAVTAATIGAGAVTAGKIAADAVTATEIAAGSVSTSELAANAVTAAKITAGTITSNEIASNTIVAGNIAASTITAGQMAAHTITAAQIATDTITASEIATGAITADELSALAVIAGKIDAGAVTTNTLAASAVTAAKIATGTITANEIATGTITAAKISTGTITANLLASTLVLASHIQVGSSMSLDPTTGLQISLTNGGLISLPADGSPAQFLKVILEATQLLVTDNFELRGSSNRISGSLNLSTGVDNPTVTPTVTAVDLTAETIAAAASTNNYRSLTDATTAWVTCDSSSNQILSINKTTGVATALLSPSTYTVYDVCKVGTNWYVYVVNLQGFYDLDEIRVYNSSWVLANIYSVPLFGTKQSAKVLATDGTDLFLVYYDTSTFATSTIKFAVTGPATRKNMMTNPTFESGVGHWVLNQGNSIGTSTAQAFSGTTSMTLNTGGLTYGAVSAAFPSSTFTPSPSNLFNYGLVVSVGGTYTLSAYFRAASTTRDAKVQMLFYDGSGVNVAGGNSTVTTGGSVSSGWTRVATTATAPAGAVFMNVVVQVQPTSGTLPASETHYVDAVMVEQAGSASSYFDGNTTAAGKFYAWKFGTNASISTECTATNPVNTTGVLTDAPADLWIGSADFGGTRYVIPGSSGVMTIWDGTSTRQASQEWVAPNSERWRGISWDGTNFHVLTEKDGSPYTAQVYKMSTQTTSITYTARYSQYDSVGTTHETAWSPSTAISVGPRKYLKVQTSAPQGSGGVDEPNRIRHYIQTTSGSLWRQADVTASPWSVTYTTLPVTSGSSAVSTPDFTGLGNPGIVQSAKVTTASSVPYIQFKGDGTWRIQDLVGMVNLWAGPVNTDPPGYLICDGRSFLRTDYPELAATLGHPVGGAESLSLYYGAPTSTTFYVPNLSGRFAVGYDGTTEFSAIGISGGTKVHTHTGPDHLHAVGDHKHTISTSNNCTITGSALRDNASTTGFMNAGASTGAMDRSSETGSPNSAATLGDGLPPYLTMYYVIKY